MINGYLTLMKRRNKLNFKRNDISIKCRVNQTLVGSLGGPRFKQKLTKLSIRCVKSTDVSTCPDHRPVTLNQTLIKVLSRTILNKDININNCNLLLPDNLLLI